MIFASKIILYILLVVHIIKIIAVGLQFVHESLDFCPRVMDCNIFVLLLLF